MEDGRSSKDELDYEPQVRGVKGKATVGHRRTSLPYDCLRESSSPCSDSGDDYGQYLKGPSKPSRVFRKQVPVCRWNITFSGDGSGNSLHSFLEDVEHYRRARNTSLRDLFNGAIDLFTGPALVWYKSIRRDIRSWEELETLLREEFESEDLEEELLREITARTQGPKEKFTTYAAVMKTYFSRMPTLLTEERKVKLLLRNSTPYYYDRLRGHRISTVEDVVRQGRRIQRDREHMSHYRPPPSDRKLLLEPDLAYRGTRREGKGAETWTSHPSRRSEDSSSSTSSYDKPHTHRKHPRQETSLNASVTPSISMSNGLGCWNCKRQGYRFQACPDLKLKLCLRCGQTISPEGTCPKCSSGTNLPEKGLDIGYLQARQNDNLKAAHAREWKEWLSVVKTCFATEHMIKDLPGDKRPYLRVKVLGEEILGLLDSGATKTLVGADGRNFLLRLGLMSYPLSDVRVSVADGRTCRVEGAIDVPFEVEGVIKVMTVLLIPEITSKLILGLDFWRIMGVVPDLSRWTWSFSETVSAVEVKEGLNDRTTLTIEQDQELQETIDKYFSKSEGRLGCTSLVSHVIDTGDASPIKQRYYPVSPVVQTAMYAELDKMLTEGVVEVSNSPWSSPIVMVRKPDGTYRFCVDYRKLNQVTKKDAYPLPFVSHILDRLRNAKYLTSLDIKSAFWQVPVHEDSREKTAFTVPGRGLFQFKRLPFGLHNSPATWQRLIDNVLGADLEPSVFVYLDDIVVCTATFQEHIDILRKVFQRLGEAGLTLNKDKCRYCCTELKYLGYIVDEHGLRVDPGKVSSIVNFPPPLNQKQIRRFIGLASWYRRFVPEFSTLVSPLTSLLKKNKKWDWDEECQSSFQKLKEALVSAPILTSPDFMKRFVIQTDASTVGLGATLSQEFGGEEKVIAYASRSLNGAERHYSATELECLAVVWAIEKFRPYIEGTSFTVITDHHSLLWLQNLKEPTGRLARWALKLQQYDMTLIHRPGKKNVVADALSRAPADMISVVDIQEKDHDPWYRKMIHRISQEPGKYPLWRVSEGRLMRRIKVNANGIPSDQPWRTVVPKLLRKSVIHDFHDLPTAGHMGQFKTIKRVAELFYWPGMTTDIIRYVSKCKVCLAQKPEQRKPQGLMGSSLTPSRPWQILSTDLIGPLPPSSKQNRYLLVVVDYFSKYVELFPLRTATTTAVLKHLVQDVFLVHGAPETIISDNGPQFRAKSFKETMRDYGVKTRYTPYYSAQCNPTERVNRVIKTSISAYVGENHRTWDKLLPQIRFAINTAQHETTGYSPAYLIYGRRLPSSGEEYKMTAPDDPNEGEQETSPVGKRSKELESLRKVQDRIQRKLQEAHQQSARPYNLRRRHGEFQQGDIVWRRTYSQSDAVSHFSAKLAPKFTQCRVKRKISPLVYELEDMQGSDVGSWHIKDLKAAPQEDSS